MDTGFDGVRRITSAYHPTRLGADHDRSSTDDCAFTDLDTRPTKTSLQIQASDPIIIGFATSGKEASL